MHAIIAKPLDLPNMEDMANGITHAIGVGGSLAGLALLASISGQTGDPWKIVSVCVYGATLVLLFTASTLYHSARSASRRRSLRMLDHAAINLLIAGTYTPFLLVNLRGPWGWSLFGTIWFLAFANIALGLLSASKKKTLRTILYLAMGWIVAIAMPPLAHSISTTGLALLIVGGIVYSLGTAFYALDKRIAYGHMVWHLFVLTGSICHFLSITLGVLPHAG